MALSTELRAQTNILAPEEVIELIISLYLTKKQTKNCRLTTTKAMIQVAGYVDLH
ncbi:MULTISPECIES: hypothetical protein [unclassified Anabaena]|uniref:hypothetical protein n=1 Tax=unclassified Anabaena TaxID=2619674 RepID=UPI0039C706C7